MTFGHIKPVLAGAMVAMIGSFAQAADFPKRPVDMIVGFKAGGGTDTYGRALASVAKPHLNGQPMVIVNRPGGGGLVGARFVADQPPTGYTLYLASAGSMILKNLIKRQVVSVANFKMVGTIGELTAGVFVPAGSSIKTLKGLIDAAKKAKSRFRWGHTGRGNVWHMAGIGFLKPNGVKTRDIPFKGGAGVRAALSSAETDFGVMGAHLGRGFEDEVRILAVLSETRHPAVPDAMTAAELGVDFIPVSTPMVVMAPSRTKDAVVAQLSEAVVAMTKEAGYRKTLGNAGLPAASANAAETSAALAKAEKDWAKLLAALKK